MTCIRATIQKASHPIQLSSRSHPFSQAHTLHLLQPRSASHRSLTSPDPSRLQRPLISKRLTFLLLYVMLPLSHIHGILHLLPRIRQRVSQATSQDAKVIRRMKMSTRRCLTGRQRVRVRLPFPERRPAPSPSSQTTSVDARSGSACSRASARPRTSGLSEVKSGRGRRSIVGASSRRVRLVGRSLR